MIGRAVGHGAITIVNAIPCGRGAALGVDLKCEAEVRLNEKSRAINVALQGEGRGEDTRLAEVTVRSVLTEMGSEDLGADVKCRSEIPAGVGLKSSSASSNVIACATFAALGIYPTPPQIVRSAVESSLKAGVSVTGAFDDSSACFLGGVCYTNNEARKLVRRQESRHTQVLIHVPHEKRYTRTVDVEALRSLSDCFEVVYKLALRGKYLEALTLNGALISGALEIDFHQAVEALRNGALAAGVSGNGPSIVALCDGSAADRVRSAWSRLGGRILETHTTNARAGAVASV